MKITGFDRTDWKNAYNSHSIPLSEPQGSDLMRYLHRDLQKSWDQWKGEPLPFSSQVTRLEKVEDANSIDGTRKILWKLRDQQTIESVIIKRILPSGKTQYTACISSQVGCAMACGFCLTGKQGLLRNLETDEIIAQVAELRRISPITNIVFMGMGEPLHNFENVVKACRILMDRDGFNFSKRRVTISTSGIVPKIRELGKLLEVSLAVSLNGSTDHQRTELMPINRKWSIAELMKACREYPYAQKRPITFEYILIAGVNDSNEDAARLRELMTQVPGKLNLIPLNEHFATDYRRPTDERIKSFQHELVSKGVTATLRVSRGRDILAACGQLRSMKE